MASNPQTRERRGVLVREFRTRGQTSLGHHGAIPIPGASISLVGGRIWPSTFKECVRGDRRENYCGTDRPTDTYIRLSTGDWDFPEPVEPAVSAGGRLHPDAICIRAPSRTCSPVVDRKFKFLQGHCPHLWLSGYAFIWPIRSRQIRRRPEVDPAKGLW